MTLRDQIMKAAAFDNDEYAKVIDENVFAYDVRLVKAAALENGRLTPLLTALADCVGAIETEEQDGWLVPPKIKQALAKLREVIG